MQTMLTTKSSIMNNQFTRAMLGETMTKYFSKTEAEIDTLAEQVITKPPKGMQDLDFLKLRMALVKELEHHEDYSETFKSGELELEYACLPDLFVTKENERIPGAGRKSKNNIKEAYLVTAKGRETLVKVEERDPGRWEIVKHILNSKTLQEFEFSAPAKATKKCGSETTALVEFHYAARSGWVVPSEG